MLLGPAALGSSRVGKSASTCCSGKLMMMMMMNVMTGMNVMNSQLSSSGLVCELIVK